MFRIAAAVLSIVFLGTVCGEGLKWEGVEQLSYMDVYTLKVKRPAIGGSNFLTHCEIKRDEIENFHLPSDGFLPGEKIECCLEAGGKKSGTLALIPFPVEAKSGKDGAVVKAVLFSAQGPLYGIYYEGFGEGEEVEHLSLSGGESIRGVLRLKKGAVSTAMPAVKGLAGGINEIEIRRRNGESLRLSLPWGEKMVPFFLANGKIGLGEYEDCISEEEKKTVASAILSYGMDEAVGSLNFYKGMEQLAAGMCQKAVPHLQMALKFTPEDSSCHASLANIYFQTANDKCAWEHIRKAVSLDPANKEIKASFYEIYRQYVTNNGYNKWHVSEEIVKQALGEPDSVCKKRGCDVYRYGLIDFRFRNGLLIGVSA